MPLKTKPVKTKKYSEQLTWERGKGRRESACTYVCGGRGNDTFFFNNFLLNTTSGAHTFSKYLGVTTKV
jgi:hypothetical protein